MKKKVKRVVSLLWMGCLCALGLCLLCGERGESYSEAENRMLNPAPTLTAESLFDGSFGEAWESFLADHVPFRERVITLYNRLRDVGSVASFEDSLEILSVGGDGLTAEADLGNVDLEQFYSPAPVQTPAPTPTPTPPPAEETAEPTPTPVPTPTPKPEASLSDYGETLHVVMKIDGTETLYYNFSQRGVLALTSVLNSFAQLLPEDGRVVFTMVPQSSIGNKYVKAENREGFYSQSEPMVHAFSLDNVSAVDATSILAGAIEEGEYVYFRSDMHWTPYGAYLVYREMMRCAGQQPAEWEDYNIQVEEPFLGTYYRDNPSESMRTNPDRLDLLTPKFDLEWRRVTEADGYEVQPFLNFEANRYDRYTVYLGGPGSWGYAVCDNGIERNCLLVCDSFGLGFLPLLTENYGQVHYYDPRYFNSRRLGHTLTEMIELNDISDIYVVVGDLHSYTNELLINTAQYHLSE